MGIRAAQPSRGATAIHGGIAHANDEDVLADGLNVSEVHGAEPLDTDVDLVACGGIPSSRNIEFFPFGGTAAHEHGVVLFIEQGAQAGHGGVVPHLGAHVDDALCLFVEHLLREAERRDVDAHEAACLRIFLVNHHLVAEWQEVVGHGERRGTGADEGDALAVPIGDWFGEIGADVVAQIGGDAFEAADGNGLAVHAPAPTCWLAGAIAGPPQNAGKHVGLAVEQIGLGVPSLGNEPEVLRDIGVRGTGPLAVYHFVVVVGRTDIRVQRHGASPRSKSVPRERKPPARRTNFEPRMQSMRHGERVRHGVTARWLRTDGKQREILCFLRCCGLAGFGVPTGYAVGGGGRHAPPVILTSRGRRRPGSDYRRGYGAIRSGRPRFSVFRELPARHGVGRATRRIGNRRKQRKQTVPA